MKYSNTLTCHFDQCDPAGILFYGNSFTLSHQTIESFVQHIGIPWADWFNNPKYAIPVRHASSDFTLPIRAGEKFKTVLHIAKLGQSSVNFEVALQNEQGQTCALVKSTHVFVDKTTGNKAKIPSEFLDRLRRYLVE
jgi:acyl-CoA thioester hydrolase/1,4-dihydroxy-2-naphthoyl-CoA hydrolase